MARGLPRLQMSLIVACTGAAGFVVSFLLLHLGVRRLALRYALSVTAAYGIFLLLVRLWLAVQRRRLDLSPAGGAFDVDLGGFGIGGGSGGSASPSGSFSGGGGSFGGGGASAVFDGTSAESAAAPSGTSPGSGVSGSGFSLDLDLDGDDLVVVVVVVAVIAACVAASAYVIVTAPALFAEVLVDGTLSAGLYRHVKGLDEESWLEAAVRRTWIPFAVVTVFFVATGVLLHRVVPEAASIRDVLHHVVASSAP
jgi:hypothetical protein